MGEAGECAMGQIGVRRGGRPAAGQNV